MNYPFLRPVFLTQTPSLVPCLPPSLLFHRNLGRHENLVAVCLLIMALLCLGNVVGEEEGKKGGEGGREGGRETYLGEELEGGVAVCHTTLIYLILLFPLLSQVSSCLCCGPSSFPLPSPSSSTTSSNPSSTRSTR